MTFKDFLKNILGGIIGILVGGSVFNVLFVLSIFLYILILKPSTFPQPSLFLIVVGWLITIGGFIFGYRSRKKKDIFYNIFYPNKYKFLISVGLALLIPIFIAIRALIVEIPTQTLGLIGIIIGLFIAFTISFYPFSALGYYFYDEKVKKHHINIQVWIIILLFLLNPIFIFFSDIYGVVYRYSVFTEPCGLKVDSFTTISPARAAGMQVGEVITKIDGVEVKNSKEGLEYLNSFSSPKIVRVRTQNNEYNLQLIYSEEHNKYIMGTNLKEERCKKSYKKILMGG